MRYLFLLFMVTVSYSQDFEVCDSAIGSWRYENGKKSYGLDTLARGDIDTIYVSLVKEYDPGRLPVYLIIGSDFSSGYGTVGDWKKYVEISIFRMKRQLVETRSIFKYKIGAKDKVLIKKVKLDETCRTVKILIKSIGGYSGKYKLSLSGLYKRVFD